MRRFNWIWSSESLLRLGLSLVLALALWIYVTGRQNPRFIDFSQPIKITTANLGADLVVTNSLQPVRIRYHADDPNQYVTPQNFRASVDLLGKGPGTYHNVSVVVAADPGIQVAKVTPEHVAVVLEPLLVRRVPVVAHYLRSNPPFGYQAGIPQINPNQVTINGPKSIVSQIKQAAVDVNLDSAQTSIDVLQKPLPEDSQGTPISGVSHLVINPAEVELTVPIRPIKSFKTLPLLAPSIRGQPAQGFGVVSLAVSPSELTVHGPPGILNHLTAISTSSLTITHLKAGQYTRRVSVRLPRGVTSSIHRTTATIVVKPVEASSSVQVAVTQTNVPPGLTAQVQPPDVLVTLLGPSTGITSAARGVSATVDLSGYNVGSYQVKTTVVAPPGFKLQGSYPVYVSVTLSAR